MKLRKGLLGALLGVTFATTLLATNSVHAETSYTGSVETNQSTENKVGWQKIGDYWYYFDKPGKKHIGWLKLNNNWYYFDNPTGIMHTYVLYTEEHGDVNGKTYYFDPQSGIMQTGWITDKGGDKHYYYSDGTMARNTKIGEYTINERGIAYIENYTGWQYKSDNWYYYVNGEAVTGWKFINNNWYYFDVYGQMATGLVSPVLMHGGGWYLLDSSGAMKTGWQKYNGEWCYFGSSGNMYMGWQKIDGKWYYFGPSKKMPELVTVNEKGEWYPYNISGAMKTGWKKINGVWYYFDASGAMKTGWLDEGGKKYYLQSSGAMATNTTVDGYKIDASGVATKVIQNGWQSTENNWYYYTNGKKVTGWKAVNNVWYYFDGSGVMKTGWQKINGVWYYFNPSGAMQKGWQKINGAWYYFGTSGAMKTGWLDEGGKKYYLQSSGVMATNITVDGYKIDASGVASESAQKADDQTIFAQTLNEYRAKSDPEKVASVYAFVDLDGDGQNELLMGDQSNRGGYYISGVYMLFYKKQIAPLGISYVASAGGVRKAVLVYQGGYVYSDEGASYDPIFHGRLIKIVGDHYIIVKEEDYSIENKKADEKFGLNQYAPLNTDTIQWQAL